MPSVLGENSKCAGCVAAEHGFGGGLGMMKMAVTPILSHFITSEEAHFVPRISPVLYQIFWLLDVVSLHRILKPIPLASRQTDAKQFLPYLIPSSVIDSGLPVLNSSLATTLYHKIIGIDTQHVTSLPVWQTTQL